MDVSEEHLYLNEAGTEKYTYNEHTKRFLINIQISFTLFDLNFQRKQHE